MREILFRGKNCVTNNWVYGNYCAAEYFNGNGVEHLIVEVPRDGVSVRIIPETVGQYTGLTDKNGTNIYEGDIVTGLFLFGMSINAVVTFKDGSFGLEWNRGRTSTFNAFTSLCNVEYEVVGNIHDNPKLLKGETDERN